MPNEDPGLTPRRLDVSESQWLACCLSLATHANESQHWGLSADGLRAFAECITPWVQAAAAAGKIQFCPSGDSLLPFPSPDSDAQARTCCVNYQLDGPIAEHLGRTDLLPERQHLLDLWTRQSNPLLHFDEWLTSRTRTFSAMLCKRRGLDADEAADMVQTGWINAIRALGKHRYYFLARLDTWLYTVMLHTCDNERRGLAIALPIPDEDRDADDPTFAAIVLPTCCEGDPVLSLERQELYRMVSEAIDHACTSSRQGQISADIKLLAVRLRFLEGLPEKEIAAKLGLNPNTVATVVRRVLKNLNRSQEECEALQEALAELSRRSCCGNQRRIDSERFSAPNASKTKANGEAPR